MMQSILHWPWWSYFLIGYVLGFMMSSWVIGWHSQEVERDRERLAHELNELRRQFRKYSARSVR